MFENNISCIVFAGKEKIKVFDVEYEGYEDDYDEEELYITKWICHSKEEIEEKLKNGLENLGYKLKSIEMNYDEKEYTYYIHGILLANRKLKVYNDDIFLHVGLTSFDFNFDKPDQLEVAIDE